jgi:hypothetical protein
MYLSSHLHVRVLSAEPRAPSESKSVWTQMKGALLQAHEAGSRHPPQKVKGSAPGAN